MSSSISDSKRIAVLVSAVLLPLLAAEAGLRVVEPKISRDVETILEMPNVARKIRDSQDPAVLIIGNSIVRRGIPAAKLEDRLSKRLAGKVRVFKAVADATTSAEWPWILDHEFLDRGAVPDAILLGVVSHIIDDAAAMRVDRVGGFFSDWADGRELFRTEITGLDSRAAFVLSRISTAFRNREALKQRVLRHAVPGYEDLRKELNVAMRAERSAAAGAGAERSFRRLAKLATLAHDHGVPVVLVMFPRRPPSRFSLDASEKAAIERLGIELVDIRDGDWVQPELFMDEIHLNASGSRRFTDALAGPLAAVLARGRPDRFTGSPR